MGFDKIIGGIGLIVGIIGTLIGVIYKSVTGRIQALETTVTKTNEEMNGKAPLLYTSTTRLDSIEKRLDRLEISFGEWMTRIEQKIDGLRKQA